MGKPHFECVQVEGDFGEVFGKPRTLHPQKKLMWKRPPNREGISFHTDKNRYYTWS